MRKRGFVFLLYALGFAVGLACAGLCLYMADNFFYTMDSRSVAARILYDRGVTKVREVRDYINRGDLAGAKAYCDEGNFDVELWLKNGWSGEEGPIWSSFGGEQDEPDKAGCALIKETIGFYSQKLPAIGNYKIGRAHV